MERTLPESERTLLVDGDVLAYRIATSVQQLETDPFGYVRPFASVVAGEAGIDNMVLAIIDGLKGTHIRIALSDSETNWRHGVMPTYKANRDYSLTARPLLLGRLKEYLRDRYGAFYWAGLEADDVLGILATEPQDYPGERIVVGRDKDFDSIPGKHWRIPDSMHRGQIDWSVREVSLEAGNRFHLEQTLSGDRVDGYPGCPGLGPERAARIMAKPVRLVPNPKGVVTKGPRKGESVTEWNSEPTTDLWACVKSHYAKAGKDEAEALRNARVARILRHEDYDQAKGEIRLWTPDRLLH